MSRTETIALVAGVLLGVSIAYVDSRPNWDDTGVTALAVLVCSGVVGLALRRRAWLAALAVGAWIPAFNIAGSGNWGSLLALGFAFAGAYAGMGARRLASVV